MTIEVMRIKVSWKELTLFLITFYLFQFKIFIKSYDIVQTYTDRSYYII